MVKLVNLGYFYSSSPNIISKFREIIELTSSVIWPSANFLGSIECKPIPSASCADMAHLVKQESILAIVAKQQWVGPVISLKGFQVSW